MESGERNVRTLVGLALLGLALVVSAALIATVAGIFRTADAAGYADVRAVVADAGLASTVRHLAMRDTAEEGKERARPARESASKTTLVYYGRARTPLIARPDPVSSRSTHPGARSPDRCTSRSLPSVSPG